MKIRIYRYNSDIDHTNSICLIDGRFQCYGIEDEYRDVKVWGETRIPDGLYSVRFRKEGGFHAKYLDKFGSGWHKGMLEICDVPNFKYVLFHIGNSDDDTAACYIVGESNSRGENFIGGSTNAYKQMYPNVRNALLRNEEVTVQFLTLDDIRR